MGTQEGNMREIAGKHQGNSREIAGKQQERAGTAVTTETGKK